MQVWPWQNSMARQVPSSPLRYKHDSADIRGVKCAYPKSFGWLVLALGLACAGCGPGPFDEQKVKIQSEAAPMRLDGEQVSLNQQQLECGVQFDLWEAPELNGLDRTVARLSAAGRALKFDDDVVVVEPGYHQPYVQIRGEFQLFVGEIPFIHDGEDGTKTAEAKIGVVIQHPCFQNPLPILGVRKGRFSQETLPKLQFVLADNRWTPEKFLH